MNDNERLMLLPSARDQKETITKLLEKTPRRLGDIWYGGMIFIGFFDNSFYRHAYFGYSFEVDLYLGDIMSCCIIKHIPRLFLFMNALVYIMLN